MRAHTAAIFVVLRSRGLISIVSPKQNQRPDTHLPFFFDANATVQQVAVQLRLLIGQELQALLQCILGEIKENKQQLGTAA